MVKIERGLRRAGSPAGSPLDRPPGRPWTPRSHGLGHPPTARRPAPDMGAPRVAGSGRGSPPHTVFGARNEVQKAGSPPGTAGSPPGTAGSPPVGRRGARAPWLGRSLTWRAGRRRRAPSPPPLRRPFAKSWVGPLRAAGRAGALRPRRLTPKCPGMGPRVQNGRCCKVPGRPPTGGGRAGARSQSGPERLQTSRNRLGREGLVGCPPAGPPTDPGAPSQSGAKWPKTSRK